LALIERDSSELLQQKQRTVTVEISDMTFGRLGVGRVGGKAVMVPFTAPGDLVEVELIREHKSYLEGRPLKVLRSSPSRRTAPCRFFPRCGGCDWQHITYDAQVALKARLVARTLSHALGLEIDPDEVLEPAPREFGYRSRVRLKVDKGGQIGFYEAASHRLVPVDECLVALPRIEIESARKLVHALGCGAREIVLAADAKRLVATIYLQGDLGIREIEQAARFVEHNFGISGVILRDARRREVIGEAKIVVEIEDGLALEIDGDCFSQVNHELNRRLVALAMEMGHVGQGVQLLDLYCGAGNFSFAAAKRGAMVLGVDNDPVAVQCAERNLQRLQLGNIRFVATNAEQALSFLARAGYRPDVVVLDPPRAGAGPLMAEVVKLRASRVLYVSCNLPTLARDLVQLRGLGFKVERIRGLDFFPNTHHVELLVSAVLT